MILSVGIWFKIRFEPVLIVIYNRTKQPIRSNKFFETLISLSFKFNHVANVNQNY